MKKVGRDGRGSEREITANNLKEKAFKPLN